MSLIQNLHHSDQDITLWINSLHCPFSDGIWATFSDRGIWFLLYAIILLVIIKRLGWKKGLVLTLGVVLTVVCCDQFANLIKNSVARLRPCWDNYMIERGLHRLERQGSFYGFFSAHAANAFGVACCVAVGLKADFQKRSSVFTWVLFIWALLVSLSRIFAGKHYFGDVLVGICVGLLFGYLIGKLALWIINKLLLNL